MWFYLAHIELDCGVARDIYWRVVGLFATQTESKVKGGDCSSLASKDEAEIDESEQQAASLEILDRSQSRRRACYWGKYSTAARSSVREKSKESVALGCVFKHEACDADAPGNYPGDEDEMVENGPAGVSAGRRRIPARMLNRSSSHTTHSLWQQNRASPQQYLAVGRERERGV